ncbi:MAG TPA: methylmalonyl-CoA mutase family protein [Xanthobacteraceae bacterium]|nr:methylmalonyl-CoA mutase family protein [Xanthobacteraceae bacterium]
MTEPTADDLPLAAEFPAATREQWHKLVEGVLKGAPFEKRLVAKTYDGLAVEPLYGRAERAQPVVGRAPGTAWSVVQRVDHPDPGAANAEALHDLENGATGLSLVFQGSIGAYGYGLAADAATITRVLDDVYLDAGITLDLDLSPYTKDAAANLAALVKRRGIAPAATNIRFGFDPLGAAAVAGGSPLPWSGIAPIVNAAISDLKAQGFRGPFASADGRVIHNAGGSEAQELAYVLAAAVAYLRTLEAGGIALDDARAMIYFRLVADADQFLTVAKFRALRKLWARVEEACGLAPKPAVITAETAWRTITQRDPYVNMLRATIAVASAGFGGADAVTVLPFTMALGLPDRFARRIARNTQLVLLEESNLARVGDPAAGAGGIEDLTEQLCRAAWTLFQEIERAGGAGAALEQGLIQKNVAATRAERDKAVARRKDALTGTSNFPDLAEAAVAVLDVSRVMAPPYPAAIRLEPLVPVRLAEPFERLRDASDRVLTWNGARPKIFLANLGKLSDFTARATFAKNFFEAGGIEGVTNDGFASRYEMIAAFKASGAKLVCLCSSDDVYAREAVEAAKALQAAGADHIYLAGRPGEHEAALTAAGVQGFIYVGCDVLATLQSAYETLKLRT